MPKFVVTERQSVALTLVAGGLSNKEIALKMGISEATVKVHVKELLKAYDVNNRTQLALKVAEAQAWRPVDETTPKDERLLCIESDNLGKVVDMHWFTGDHGPGSWRGSMGQFRQPVLWRRYPALPDPFLNPGLAASLSPGNG